MRDICGITNDDVIGTNSSSDIVGTIRQCSWDVMYLRTLHKIMHTDVVGPNLKGICGTIR